MPNQRNYSFTYTDDTNVALEFENSLPDWSIILKKVDENETSLAGALFGIYSPDKDEAMTDAEFEKLGIDDRYATRTADDGTQYYLVGVSQSPLSGMISWSGLGGDLYAVFEIKAPKGFTPDVNLHMFTRTELGGSNTAEIVVVNRSGVPIPETGGSGLRELFKWLGILSFICCATYCSVMFIRKRLPS